MQYSILKYTPPLATDQTVDIAVLLYWQETRRRQFCPISGWQRVAHVANDLDISSLRDIIDDIAAAVGAERPDQDFDISRFCAQYCGELFFSEIITLSGPQSAGTSMTVSAPHPLSNAKHYN